MPGRDRPLATDAFDMAIAHRAFRTQLHNAPRLIRDVQAGDTARSAVVGAHLEFIFAALHHHHAAEDDLIWPKLHARAPASAAEDITRMETAHRGIAEADAKVKSVLAPWITSADTGVAEELLEGVEVLIGQVDKHLADEELTMVPLINKYITPEEWQQCIARASEFISRRNLKLGLVMGGLVLDASSAEEARRLLASVPQPQRTLVRLLARRTLARYQATVYGSAA